MSTKPTYTELEQKVQQLEHEAELRKRSEEAFRESEERYRSLVESIGIGVALISSKMEILTLNRQMKNWFPLIDDKKRPICYRAFNSPPKDDVCTFCPTIKTLADGCTHEAVTETPVKGAIRHYRIISTPVNDKNGKTISAIEVVEDITEPKRAAEKVRESEEKYRIIAEQTGQMVYDCNVTTGRINWSGNIKAISGYLPEAFQTFDLNAWQALIHPDDRSLALKLIDKAMQRGSKYQVEYRFKRNDGIYLYIEDNGVFLNDERGIALRMLGTMKDITERKQAEKALQNSEKELRLLSAQLMKAQENERKRIARELHDTIAQNLVTIKMFLHHKVRQTVEDKVPPEPKIETILSTVENSIIDIRKIIDNLRPSILDDLGILAAIRSYCREFQKIYKRIGVERQIDISESEVPDSLKVVIYRVLQEAMHNIAKHSEADLVRIGLGRKNGRLEMIVTDNGSGFEVNKVVASADLPKGWGLIGMKERIELSGGSLLVVSRNGKGTHLKACWDC